jgi:phosphoglucomutase
MEKMANIMETLRATAPSSFADMDVVKVDDYKTSTSIDVANGDTNVIELPKSNVLAYTLTGGNKIIVRPSGTEPKIKAYITAIGKDRAEAQVIADKLLAEADELMK